MRLTVSSAMSGHKRPCSPAFPPDRPACASAQTCAAHLLIAFALLKGVAGAVAVLEKGEAAAGKLRFYKVLDDGFLVLDGYIVPVNLVIDGDTGVACYAEGFCHGAFLLRYRSVLAVKFRNAGGIRPGCFDRLIVYQSV